MSLRRRVADVGPTLDPVLAARQFAHEHSRAYDAVRRAANLLEMAGPGHARDALLLQAIRHRLNGHLADGDCRGE